MSNCCFSMFTLNSKVNRWQTTTGWLEMLKRFQEVKRSQICILVWTVSKRESCRCEVSNISATLVSSRTLHANKIVIGALKKIKLILVIEKTKYLNKYSKLFLSGITFTSKSGNVMWMVFSMIVSWFSSFIVGSLIVNTYVSRFFYFDWIKMSHFHFFRFNCHCWFL